MRISGISIFAITLVVIAVAIAGCSSTSPTTPAVSTTPASGSVVTTSAPVSNGGSVSGSELFGGLSYNWVEYKMSTGSGSDSMTIFYKYDKLGKCSMRFEGAGAANMPANMQNIDCSAQGGSTSQNDPNKVSPDTQVTCSPLEESITVPAGTFSATKCTMTMKEGSATTWVVKNKFMVKMQSSSGQGSVDMVLNSYG